MEPVIRNIKLSFKVKKNQLQSLKKTLERLLVRSPTLFIQKQNFVLCKLSVSFSIFITSGHINATGIKRFEDINRCFQLFHSMFKVSRKNTFKFQVDNITASGNWGEKIKLDKLKQIINSEKNADVLVSFDSNRFPGAFIKFKNMGTLSIFKSGKYNIVGAKNHTQIDNIFQLTWKILQNHQSQLFWKEHFPN